MAKQKRFNQRKLHGPGGKSSDLSALVTTDERAAYIRTVLWPEAEMAGRPGILCSELQRATERLQNYFWIIVVGSSRSNGPSVAKFG